MNCSSDIDIVRSASSSPEPDNNNEAELLKFKSQSAGLDPSLIPDPGCGVDIRLSPTISQVDEEGTGRPARVEVTDLCKVKSLTGEESQFSLALEEGPTHHAQRSLGLLTAEKVSELLQNVGPDSLFTDPDFPADHSALFYSRRPESELSQFSWARPHQLVATPRLFVDGTSRRDVIQGVLGDCWLLSTCAALAKKEELLYRVIEPSQALYGPGYTGLITVNLWRYGSWVTVYIDDRLEHSHHPPPPPPPLSLSSHLQVAPEKQELLLRSLLG